MYNDQNREKLAQILNIAPASLAGAGFTRGVLAGSFTAAQMTDGGGATGTYKISKLPVGCRVEQAMVHCTTAFSGDTSATLTIGDGTDVDRYNTGTPSVFAAGQVDMGVPSGTIYHSADKDVTFTITSGSDFTILKTAGTGAITYFIEYIIPA